jgi:hypothetical protein
MTDQELSELVAKKVMGWRRVTNGEALGVVDDCDSDDWVNALTNNWMEGGEFVAKVENEGSYREDFEPGWSPVTNISDAWDVHAVACKWRLRRRVAYLDALTDTIRGRIGVAYVWPTLLIYLEPRDICLAALQASRVGVPK